MMPALDGLNPVTATTPVRSTALMEEGEPQAGFAPFYQQAKGEPEVAEGDLTTGNASSSETDGQVQADDKKLSPEEATAAFLLFLLSQQLPASPPPDDWGATNEGNVQAAEGRTPGSALPPLLSADDSNAETAQERLQALEPDKPASAEDSALELEAGSGTEVKKTADNTAEGRQQKDSPKADNAAADEKAVSNVQKAEDRTEAKASAIPAAISSTDRPRPDNASDSAAPRLHASTATAAPPATERPAPPLSQALEAALPLRSGQFSELLAGRVMWLSSQNLQEAHIQLEPAELGKLSVHVALSHGQAEVGLASSQAEVRAVLEGQLPRLQEMLENQGINAPRLGIFDASGGQGREQGSRQPRASSKAAASLPPEESLALPSIARHGQTLVDYYA